eukprot:2953067-Pleurochrysis_carterae.AAC.1
MVEQIRVFVLQQLIHLLLHELDVPQLVVLERHSLFALGSHGGQLVPGGVEIPVAGDLRFSCTVVRWHLRW